MYYFGLECCNGCGVSPFPSFAKVIPSTPILISKLNLNYWMNGTKGKSLCTILYIDHIDNDDSHNVIENFQLLCPSCNVIKNPKNSQTVRLRPKTPEMERGDKQELRFRNFVHKEVVNNDWVKVDDMINGGSEYLTNFDKGETLSPETAKRYIGKMVSITGKYSISGEWMTFKWKLPQLDEWLNKQDIMRDNQIEKTRELSESYG